MNRLSLLALAVLVVAVLVCGGWMRATYDREWLQPDLTAKPPVLRPWVVEADCYSQMARVDRILKGQGLIQSHFTVENWPEGMAPSTTSLFDYLILLLYLPLKLFTVYPLDWAGALVSPFLWIALSAFWLFFRSREFNTVGKTLLVIGLALLPSLIWATAFGRPKHLSLTLVLVAMALTAEFERWHVSLGPKRTWPVFAGVMWGLACWSSLFEPLILLAVVVLFNLAVRRRENVAFLVSFAGVMALYFLIEGFHVIAAAWTLVSPGQYQTALTNWLSSIAEIQGYTKADLQGLFIELTLMLFLLPLLAIRLVMRPGDRRTDWLLIGLTGLLFILTIYQRRWIYYVSLAELLLIVRYCQQLPLRWTRVVVIFFFLAALAEADYERMRLQADALPNQQGPELAMVANSIRDEPGGIIAPWWISPGLLYFSGQPIVSGSSHCGISGIADSAKFFTATSWIDAENILRERKVRWVLVMDDRDDPNYIYPCLNVQRRILGLPVYGNGDTSKYEADRTVWQILLNQRFVPTYMRLHAVTPNFRLYEYVPSAM